MSRITFKWLAPFIVALLLVIGAAEFLAIAPPAIFAQAKASPWAVKSASLDSRLTTGYWAFDQYTLRYQKVAARSFVLHFDAASYITVAGPSPAGTHHINALVRGSFSGSIEFSVAGGNFNPDAVCSINTCSGDTILAGIQRFARLTFGNSASASEGDFCFAYLGGDRDNDAGDEMQQASLGVSCSILGSGNQGDIYV